MRVCPTCQSRYLGDDPFCSKDGQPTIEADPSIRFDPLIGSNVGNYKITALLGEGGMGAVYKAEHPSIGRIVAIKVLRGEYAYRQDTIERFFNEARSVNQIRHENIVDIIDFGLLTDQRPYFIMEYLEGSDLDGHLRKRGATSLTEALDIMMPVLSALQAAHDEGIIHRDLKPENIFLYERKHGGRVVKLLDFGIAKLLDAKEQFHKTNTGSIIGTPAYMSPEQAAGRKDIDHRADVYAAGIILYELLVGEPPFDGDTALEIVHKQWKEKPPSPRKKRPELPEEFELIIYAALEKDRDKRIQSASQFASRLKAAIAKVNVSHAKPSNKATAAPGVKLPSSPGVSGLRAALQPRKEPTPPPSRKEPTPQPLKKEPTPTPPRVRVMSGGYPLLKPSSGPGSASPKPNNPTPDKLARPQYPGKSGGWSVLKPGSGKLPEPVKELPAQSIQKTPGLFKKPSLDDRNDQSTEAVQLSSLPANFLEAIDRNEETRMVSELSGGSLDELRNEATRMASELSGGSLALLREADAGQPLLSTGDNADSHTESLESTHLGSVISGGSVEALRGEVSVDELRNEATRMASELSGGSLDKLRTPATPLFKKSPSLIPPLKTPPKKQEPMLAESALSELRSEETRVASELSGGSLALLRDAPKDPSTEAAPVFAESTQLGSVISGGSVEALQKEVLQSEPTRMASELSGGSLDALRAEDTNLGSLLEGHDGLQDQDESTVAGDASMSAELSAALYAPEHNAESAGFLENIDAPELLGDESTQNNAAAHVRDLEEEPAPPVSEYEEPSIMKVLPQTEDISSAHTSILDYDHLPETLLARPVAAAPEMPAMPPIERPPRRETPPISGEVAPPLAPQKKAAQPSRLILMFVVLAVLSGVVAVLVRQLGSSPQLATPAPESQKTTPATGSAPANTKTTTPEENPEAKPPNKPTNKLDVPKGTKSKKPTDSKPPDGLVNPF